MNINIKTLNQGKLSAIYISDLHFESDKDHNNILNFFNKKESDIFIIAGDLAKGTQGEFFIQHLVSLGYIVLYVLGNHEFWDNDIDETISAWREISNNIDNFYFLEKDTVTINDVDFIGACLWTSLGTKSLEEPIDWFIKNGVKTTKDFERINKLKPESMKHLFFQAKDYIFSQLDNNRKQVVISHYLPSEMSSHERYRKDRINNALFFTELGNEIAYSSILVWVHGHTHDTHNYFINETNILCNPRGYKDYNMLNSQFSWDQCRFEINLN